jgi:SAM-dependent methyltransferase
MNPTPDPARLYTSRTNSYVRFVRSIGYPRGIRAFFLRSPLLHSGIRVLDAGCGTGIVTLALREALERRGLKHGPIHGFDLTPAMLEHFRQTLQRRAIGDVDLVQADVLQLDALPDAWNDYELIVSAAMLEYLPKHRLVDALAGLRGRLGEKGSLLLFVTRRNWLMQPLIGRWWEANLYTAAELRAALDRSGFSTIEFRSFPLPFRHLALWGHIVEARAKPRAAPRRPVDEGSPR